MLDKAKAINNNSQQYHHTQLQSHIPRMHVDIDTAMAGNRDALCLGASASPLRHSKSTSGRTFEHGLLYGWLDEPFGDFESHTSHIGANNEPIHEYSETSFLSTFDEWYPACSADEVDELKLLTEPSITDTTAFTTPEDFTTIPISSPWPYSTVPPSLSSQMSTSSLSSTQSVDTEMTPLCASPPEATAECPFPSQGNQSTHPKQKQKRTRPCDLRDVYVYSRAHVFALLTFFIGEKGNERKRRRNVRFQGAIKVSLKKGIWIDT